MLSTKALKNGSLMVLPVFCGVRWVITPMMKEWSLARERADMLGT